MRRTAFLFLLVLFLSGCATYKFQRGREPYDKGYIVSRDDYTILEYTLGKDNSVPEDMGTAQDRFRKRRKIVEHYYKKMGLIENHFKMAFLDPAVFFVKMIGGIFRLPFVAISDYKYEHNPAYRERIKKLEEEKDRREEARIKIFKDALNIYLQRDMALEQDLMTQKEKRSAGFVKQEVLTETLAHLEQEMAKEKVLSKEEMVPPKQEQPVIAVEEKPVIHTGIKPEVPIKERIEPSHLERKRLSNEPLAIIIAKPIKGYSPLKVRFYGYKSYSPFGKIISYSWDFGDGDTSNNVNPTNTYYSGSFEPKDFTVTLTVQDEKGNTAKTNTIIKVTNK